jgi:hypothetical protein
MQLNSEFASKGSFTGATSRRVFALCYLNLAKGAKSYSKLFSVVKALREIVRVKGALLSCFTERIRM